MDHSSSTPSQPAPGLELLPAQGAPELLFLLFHGIGRSAEDMTPLATRLRDEYPRAAVLALNAPHAYDRDGRGYQWYSTLGLSDEKRLERADAALPRFIEVIRACQARFEMAWERTALFGFSQGAIMSLEAVQREPALAGRVLAFGGRYVTPPAAAPIDTTVHFCHGLADPIVPYAVPADAAERLIALGGDVTADILPAVGHELHPKLIDKAIEQLRTFLPKKVWREALAQAPVLPRVASSRELGGGGPMDQAPGCRD